MTGPHDKLVRHMQQKYYSNMSEGDIRDLLLSDKSKFQKALDLTHADSYSHIGYDEFVGAYYEKNGNPFEKKKNFLEKLQNRLIHGMEKARNWLWGTTQPQR